MKPFIIGIAGAHSGSGKTLVACEILRKIKGLSAIKYTKSSLYSSIIDDPLILSEKGKDTARMLKAGAEKVLWIQSPTEEISSLINIALNMLIGSKGIVIEGNSAVKAANPDILIFVLGDLKKIKPGSEDLIEKADILIFEKNFSFNKNKADKFSRDDVEGYIGRLKDLLSKIK